MHSRLNLRTVRVRAYVRRRNGADEKVSAHSRSTPRR